MSLQAIAGIGMFPLLLVVTVVVQQFLRPEPDSHGPAPDA